MCDNETRQDHSADGHNGLLPIVVSQNPSVIPVVVDAIPSYLIIATTISDY